MIVALTKCKSKWSTYYIRGEGGCALAGSCSVVTVSVSLCTNVSQADLNNSFLLYPNPAHNKLSIEANGVASYQVVIYDAVGQLVLSDYSSGSKTVIDIAHLSVGLYYARLITSHGVVIKKVIKN